MADRGTSVVFVTSVFEDGNTGPATFARYLYSYFAELNEFDFHIVAPLEGIGPRIHGVPSRHGLFASRIYGDLQRRALKLASELPENTVVHVNNTFTMGELARHRGPTIVQVNDYDLARLRRTIGRKIRAHDFRGVATIGARRIGEGRALRHATVAVCNSEATAAEIRSAYNPPDDKIRVVHKAVNVDLFTKPRQTSPDPPWPSSLTAGRLVFVGSDWHRKGLDLLLYALLTIAELHSVQLVVIGEAAPATRRRFARLTADLGLASTVAFLGRLNHADLVPWLWSADMAVMPSRDEAFGVAALEAMAAGLPVVACNTGGLREIVSAENGLLVPPEDVPAIAEAVASLLRDTHARHRCRDGALKTAARFRADEMCAQYKALYKELSERLASRP